MTDNDQNTGGTGDERAETNAQNSTNADLPASTKILEHFKTNRIDSLMLATRVLTVFFTFGYVLPIFGTQESTYGKALIANAATSTLRLHQRLPAFTFSREFFGRLVLEDSFHYLIFSMLLFSVQPTLLCLVPITLFAILHSASYSLKLLDLIGQNSWWGARFLISLVEFQAANLLKAVAFSEIFLMPLLVIYTFLGRAGMMTPIMYYQFLVMRYSSRRNRYTRNAFRELRVTAESLAVRAPSILSRIIYAGINFVSRLAPPEQPATAQ